LFALAGKILLCALEFRGNGLARFLDFVAFLRDRPKPFIILAF
jgi:hypothetical protein